jgi:hypothetical protein
MPKVLVTGMSGTGKSTALRVLAERGHRVVDTDTDEWSHWVTLDDGSSDWVWREDAMADLLVGHQRGALFVAGCKSNQDMFYPSRNFEPARRSRSTPRYRSSGLSNNLRNCRPAPAARSELGSQHESAAGFHRPSSGNP